MAQIQDGLSQQQAFALIFETTSARNLLGYGIRALRNSAFLETTADPIMTMLSIGSEKLLKMTLGLIHVADNRAWPPRSQFKDVWKHDLVIMNRELLLALRTRLPLATHRAVVEPRLVAVEGDLVWEPLVATLSRYGQSGRFYHLDALAESPQAADRPEAYWNQAEQVALKADSELEALFHASVNDAALFDEFTRKLNERMADSVQRWWELVALAGKHGMLGERGGGWGFDVEPGMVGRQVRGEARSR